MIRTVLLGAWMCLVVLLTSHLFADYRARRASDPAETTYFNGISYEKTRAINVPVIRQGAVTGYIVAKFVYTADAATLRAIKVPPESFILDEAFQALFTNADLDPQRLARFDMQGLLGRIASNVNRRLDRVVIREMLIETFNYVDKSQIR